ncbi:MAG TPA: tRNA lysidine(34) synthetase TilS [Solirubrobacterales bacterium]|nr:tRNA lysidine(34) synthetase TilS [Solirubrobacterales bacterium]
MDADLILERVREGGILVPGEPLVAMLSGGRDSVCLLDLAVRIAGAEAVTALHVNYGLRDDSDEDERHCAELCEGLGVRLEVERQRRPEGAGNLQAWARDRRYAAAARLALAAASGEGEATIATGHTADDQVETILYRLASSPSRRALLGMKPRDGRLVRPLLALTRAETTAYCEARGLTWRDDPSNEGDAYARNRVRHGLLPALAEIHPAAAANVLRTAELLRDEATVLDALVEAEIGAAGAPRATITLERLGALPPALRRLVVQQLADGAAGRPVPGAARFAEQVAGLRRTGRAQLDLGGGVRAVVESGVLHAER